MIKKRSVYSSSSFFIIICYNYYILYEKGISVVLFNTLSFLEPYILQFILNYVVFFNSFYAFIKTQHIRPILKRAILVFIINIFISVLFSILIVNKMIGFAQTISYAGIILSFLLVSNTNKNNCLLVGLITTSYAHILKSASYIITSIIVYSISGAILNIVPHIITCIISVIINLLFMKIRRLKNGVRFFEKTENLGIGLILSGIVYLSILTEYENSTNLILVAVIVFGVAFLGFGLYLWIKKSITKHYRENQQLKSDIQYKKQLEQKEAEIEQLNRSNDFLSKVVHRDNHLMSSLSTAIDTYKKTKSDDNKEKLLDEIKTLINERGELIQTELKESKLFSSTGNSLIDSAINDLYIKAAAHGMDFNLSVSKTVDEIIGKYISQTDLQTLICDHIKDAIIAVDAKNENNGKILVELSMENDNYTITIFDSGVDFEIDTLAKLGKERVTTHADNGGSGIGFMTTFETLRKSYASLIITEFENKTPFSKSVSIRFDGNTAFIIQSYRKEELKSVLNRDDVILL